MSNEVLFEMSDNGELFQFNSTIENELNQSKLELEYLEESLQSIKTIKPECDKFDYMLSVGSGMLCSIIDIFLVGTPGKSVISRQTDDWFEEKTKDFAKIVGWNNSKDNSASSAIRFLEKKFDIPYDQRGAGDTGSNIFNLTPTNHHFKSLAHNPSLLGLFFSIIDQFMNESHFISNGELLSLQQADEGFELRGHNLLSKLFSAFVNWFGHLISDVSGSSGSKGRGMGIPSPLWTWTNDIIAIKNQLNFPVFEFDKAINDVSINLFNKGYDARFQMAQVTTVVLNEMIVRFFYSIRRLIRYFTVEKIENQTSANLWEKCNPFSSPTVKRMLTVAHGVFCIIDLGDATLNGIKGGAVTINPIEFFLRLNIMGVGRFTISLYGEANREISHRQSEKRDYNLNYEKEKVKLYIEGLEELSRIYNDQHLIKLISDLSKSDIFMKAMFASVELSELRKVPKANILYTKEAGDNYFGSKGND